MAGVLPSEALPRWRSTRDGRDRLDLVTDAVASAPPPFAPTA